MVDIIPVLDHLAQKINSLVPNLREPPVGVSSKVMMTMTTSTTDLTSPRRYPTQLTSDTPSFILKELPESSSSIRCCDDDCYDTSPILREFPTKKKTEPNATAAVELLDDDDDIILPATAQEDSTPAPTFLQEWEAFYTEFKQSITHTLAHSSAASLLPSLIDDDDAEEDQKIHDCPIDQLPTNCSAGLRRLHHSVRELEKVNLELAFVASRVTPEPHQPTLRASGSNPPYPRPCSEPQRDRIPQYAPPMETSPAPHLASPNQNPTQQLGPEPRRDDAPQIVPTTAPPPAPNLSAGPSPHQTQQSSPTARNHSTIPNWARPAVTSPASMMAGRSCTEKKPPPRPERKTVPFRKKPQTKPHAANQKDFLRPP